MSSKLITHDSTSDESSSYVIINDNDYNTKVKKSQSLQSFKKHHKDSFSYDSSSSSNDTSLNISHSTSKRKPSSRNPKKEAQFPTMNSKILFKYFKITLTITIVILILVQAIYNFFIYKNKISINTLSEIDVQDMFRSEINEKIITFDQKHFLNRTWLILLNKTQPTPEELEQKQVQNENNQIYNEEFNSFLATINRVYNESNIPLHFCPKIPEYLEGHLDSELILKRANLSKLVQFYDGKNKNKTIQMNKEKISKSKNKFVAYQELFYLNGTEFAANESGSENWLLWNSNNMTGLLNLSKNFFGDDGERVEIGKNKII